MLLPSRLPRLLLGAASLLAAAACSSPDHPASEEARRGDGERGVSIDAVADGEALDVNAVVWDDRGQPTVLRPGEFFVAKIGSDAYVLTLGQDERGDPLYRARTPALLHYADVEVQIASRDDQPDQIALVRVTEPFRIERAPTQIRPGDELRIDFARTTSSPSGHTRIAFDGPCVARTEPALLQTYGGMDEARFDTTNLSVSGSCDVTVDIMVVNEQPIRAGSFAPDRSTPARGMQRRSFVVRVDP